MNPTTVAQPKVVAQNSAQISREIFRFEGNPAGPNLIFIGGMHGNEPSGVQALQNIAKSLGDIQSKLEGNVYAIRGNIKALREGERFLAEDLNRLWQTWRVNQIMEGSLPSELQNPETAELGEIWTYVSLLMEQKPGPFIFVDLHTTSVNTVPFATMSDTIMNRRFTKNLPLPVVIGIEEYLDEPLLSYVNELGCVSIAFEAGQHDDPVSIQNHEALIWLSLVQAELLNKGDVANFDSSHAWLKLKAEDNQHVYEIRMRQALSAKDSFKMNLGFTNFQPIDEGQDLAELNGERVSASEKGLILMPLYQSKGSDGFFIIRNIPKFWLGVSYIFRKLAFHKFLPFLPGVYRFSKEDHIMAVDKRVAKWYSKEILHLMGYRRKQNEDNKQLFVRRVFDLKGPR